MDVIYKPNCLTMFFEVPLYEIYCAGELNRRNPEKIIEESFHSENVIKEGQLFIGITKQDMGKIARNEADLTNLGGVYNPIEEVPNLYTELVKIKDYKSFKKFIGTFGLPVGTNFYKSVYNVLIHEMDLYAFHQQLSTYKKTLDIYEALRLHDEIQIKNYAEEFKQYASDERIKMVINTFEKTVDMDDLMEKVFYHSSLPYKSEEWYNNAEKILLEEEKKVRVPLNTNLGWNKNDTPETQVRKYLVELLNNCNKGNSTFTLANDQIQPAVSFSTLFEVAYFQLSRAVIGNIEMRRCEHCGALFEVTHESRRFCPPLPKHDISSCQNSYNTKVKRKRKKARELSADGLSIKEIAMKLKITSSEVETYLGTNKKHESD